MTPTFLKRSYMRLTLAWSSLILTFGLSACLVYCYIFQLGFFVLLLIAPIVFVGIIGFGFFNISHGICPYCGTKTLVSGKIASCNNCDNYFVNDNNSLSKLDENFISEIPVFKVTVSDLKILNNFSHLSPISNVCCVCGGKATRTVLVVPDSMLAQFSLSDRGIMVPHCDLHDDGATCSGGQYKNRFNLFFRSYPYCRLVKNIVKQ